MSHHYYIKVIDALVPDTDFVEGVEQNIGFAGLERNLCERFSECVGFFLYENSGKGRDAGRGSKSIFAQGRPTGLRCEIIDNPPEKDGKKFPLGTPVFIERRVKAINGIPKKIISQLCPRLERNTFQAHGGLVGLSREEFEVLKIELDKCL